MNNSLGIIDLEPVYRPKLVVDSLPAIDQLSNGSIVGHYSYRATGVDSDAAIELANGSNYRPEFPLRIVSRRHARLLPGTNLIDTETAFTRCYLKSLPRAKARRQEIDGRRQTRPPQYCQPTVSNVETLYVDITSAYQSVYQRMSWRVRYLRGKYFSNDEDKIVYPFPKEWKSGRSYIVTGALPGTVNYVMDHKVLMRQVYNPYENPNLVAAVWDVLSAIARFAVDVYGAKYYNLDGAIVPDSRSEAYQSFLESLGLTYKTKYRGRAHILNLAVWRIGDRSTVRYGTQNMAVRTDAIPVTLKEAEWILARFARM